MEIRANLLCKRLIFFNENYEELLILCDIGKNVYWMLMNAGKLQLYVNFLEKKKKKPTELTAGSIYMYIYADWLFNVQETYSCHYRYYQASECYSNRYCSAEDWNLLVSLYTRR